MSLPNSLLRLWAARLASKIAICSAMTYDLYQLQKARSKEGAMKLAVSDDKRRQLRHSASRQNKEKRSLEDVFIESLVAAGSCRHHQVARRSNGWSACTTRSSESRRRPSNAARFVAARHFSSTSHKQQTAPAALPEPEETTSEETVPDEVTFDAVTRDEVNELVNTYSSPADLWDKPEHAPPTHYPLAPRIVIPPEKEDKPPYAPRIILPPEDPEHSAGIYLLHRLLKREPGRVSHTKLWELFTSLRAPRLRYIPDDDIRRAFRHLSWVEFRSSENMPRYLALLEECLEEGITVEQEEWNTAIAYAGRWVRNVTTQEVKGAVETWMRMERAGVEADNVTFNILFDVAVKAGRFALADTIFGELKSRGMPLSRYFRTSMIYYAGMKGDGDAVRQAFRDLVNAGEIVDTSIMNCVILSLVRAGEPAAAEHVFAKMKRLYEQKLGVEGPRDWKANKEIGRLLHKTATRLRKERRKHEASFFGSHAPSSVDERKEEVQKLAPIAPDARTYRILIQHHAYTSGDMQRIKELLAEMKDQGHHVHGSVYMHLFRGFWQHGGHAYTAWNRKTLESFWSEFLTAATATSTSEQPSSPSPFDSVTETQDFEPEQSEEDRAPYFTLGLAHAVVRAFYKCAGRKKMVEVWEQEVKGQWEGMSGDEKLTVQSSVDRMVAEDSVYIVE